MKSKLIQELDWANIENVSEPLTPLQLKAVASVLTRGGIGSVICPRCNELSLVRDSILQCHCRFKANIVDCACGCRGQLLDKQYIWGHQTRGKLN